MLLFTHTGRTWMRVVAVQKVNQYGQNIIPTIHKQREQTINFSKHAENNSTVILRMSTNTHTKRQTKHLQNVVTVSKFISLHIRKTSL